MNIDINSYHRYPFRMSIDSPILSKLYSLINEKGRITFEEFMDIALYHPEYGYYTSERARIGKEGDYYTSADVHKAFGSCIMRQIEEMWGIMCRDVKCYVSTPLNLVEVGAGKGLLCADILISAREKSPPLFDSLRYFIVEKSSDFIVRQKKHLEGLGLLDKVFWVSEVKDAIPDGIGIILSNELMDAFPVHKVRYSN
ncbi:MAG: SAM-dependent methyltransferase, partial [Deltaproteobacteria bacterium]